RGPLLAVTTQELRFWIRAGVFLVFSRRFLDQRAIHPVGFQFWQFWHLWLFLQSREIVLVVASLRRAFVSPWLVLDFPHLPLLTPSSALQGFFWLRPLCCGNCILSIRRCSRLPSAGRTNVVPEESGKLA